MKSRAPDGCDDTGTNNMRTPAALLTITAAACLAAGPTTQPSSAPSVDQRIDQLLAPPPPRPSPPRQAGRTKPGPPLAPLRAVREGTYLESQTGRLDHTGDGHTAVFTFDGGDGTAARNPPMIVLPNLELDAMEREQATLGGDVTFAVWGSVTEYKGRNYLRIDRASNAGGEGGASAMQPLPRSAGRVTDLTSGRGAVAPGAPAVRLVRGGTHLVDQTGRLNLTPDGRTAVFTFETDGKTMRDPPMVLLPNLKLANMEGQQAGLTKDAKFRVSGTVTEYHGRNYLLLDKAVAAADFDAEF